MQVVAGGAAHLVADLEGAQHVRPAQVEIPVLEAQRLVDVRVVVQLERQRARLVEDADLGDLDLDRTGGELGFSVPAGRAPTVPRTASTNSARTDSALA